MPLQSVAPFVPPDGWLVAFETQATVEMVERMLWYAARQVQGVVAVVGAGSASACERVQDALTQTLDGAMPWAPEAKSLQGHLVDAVRWRAWNDRINGARPATEYRNTDQDDTAELMPVEPTADATRSARSERKFLQVLRALIPSDQGILELLDDEILHGEAIEQMEGITTEEGRHAARNLLQWTLIRLEQFRREARATTPADPKGCEPIPRVVQRESTTRMDALDALDALGFDVPPTMRASLWKIRSLVARGRK